MVWDLGHLGGTWVIRLEFGPGHRDFDLQARICALKLGFEPYGCN